jgi:ribosome-binding protein aMBF1 (putative translation factor)
MSASRRPTNYAAITRYTLERLPSLLKRRRAERGLSIRVAAKEIGIGKSTLHAVEGGRETDSGVLIKIFEWLDIRERKDAGHEHSPSDSADGAGAADDGPSGAAVGSD